MATESDIRTWIKGYERDFDQLCQALMWQLANRFGRVASTPSSAIAAYNTEKAAGRVKAGTPPPGAFVYWDIGMDGHVGFMVNGGRVFMGTKKVDEQWSKWNTGPQGLADYSALTSARYLGWSYQNGGNTVPFTPSGASAPAIAGGGVNHSWYQLTAPSMKACQQMLDALNLYDGPDDGDFGHNSVVGMMKFLKRRSYLPANYVVDGVPHNSNHEASSRYGFALQDWAKDDAGYDGVRDGKPASYTSQFIVRAAARVKGSVPAPNPVPVHDPMPVFPPAPDGYAFMPDLGSSQSGFDFAEYAARGGKWAAVKMGGANAGDSPYVAPAYLAQVARARAQAIKLVHYWFNGEKNGMTPALSADYFKEKSLFQPGDIVALDVEDEPATSTKAWTPAQAVAFAKRLAVHYPGIRGLAYMSDSVADAEEWDALVSLGWQLWAASWGGNTGEPNTPPSTDDWPRHLVWQYTSVERVPGNFTVTAGIKTYKNTDGNLAVSDLFDQLGYVAAIN